MSTYPPEPWELRGQLHASVFLVPLTELSFDLPPGWRPVRLGRRAIVGTAWVSYEPGGVLSYDELMSTVVVRRGWRVMPTITHIWVDSETSRDGGRALWGIPKALAKFTIGGGALEARNDDGVIAAGSVHVRTWLPGRWPVRFSVVQRRNGAAKVSPVRTRSRIGLSRVEFVAAQDGPLAFLHGRRALISVSMGDFAMRFGGG